MVGSLAAGVLLFIYEFYQHRNNQHEEAPHGYGGGGGGAGPGPGPMIEEDILDLDSARPAEVRRRIGKNRTLPGQEEVCSICLDKLVRRDADCRYCIIALPECGHWFHQKCAIRLLEYHPMCPVCRTSIDGTRLRGTPVRVLQASDIVENENRTAPPSYIREQQLTHADTNVVNGRIDEVSQQPVAGCSKTSNRPVNDYQDDDDLD